VCDGATATAQNPINQFATDGTYNVTLTATTDHNCSADVTQAVTVHPLPVADFTNTTVCALITTDYTDQSTVTSGTITNWDWYFGDGNTSANQNTTNLFASGGTFTSSLVVTTALGCQDSVAIDVIVYPKPETDFTWMDACLNDAHTFADATTISGSILNTWEWDFGDGSGTSVVQNPIYTFQNSGQYTVELISTTADGCKDTVEHVTDVFDLPVADFAFSNICEDDSVLFSDLSTIPSGVINSWEWDFGNGETSLEANPDYQRYIADGNYDIELIVASGNSCADTLVQQIEIYPVPIAEFTFDSVCFPNQVQFSDLSDANGTYPVTTWTWVFSDGQTSNLQSPSIDFGIPGTFSADLLITNGPGCKSSFSAGEAVVHPLPVPDFPEGLATCLEDTIFFTDLSSIVPITDDEIVNWTWSFDDGNSSTQVDPFHIYTTHDLYDVNLMVETNHGCTENITRVVEIYPLPEVEFIADPPMGCAPLLVQFIDQTSIPSPYAIQSWDWWLGADSLTSTSPSNVLVYNPELGPLDVAQYDIRLTATSTNGCVTELLKPNYVTVYPKPEAAFSVDEEVQNIIKPRFEFTDLSTENVTNWDWSFGDGTYDSDQHPIHYYDAIGDYPVQLIIQTQYGCADTAGIYVEVEPVFTFYIPNSFTPNEDNVNEEFFVTVKVSQNTLCISTTVGEN
jgi:PKD repeat protein